MDNVKRVLKKTLRDHQRGNWSGSRKEFNAELFKYDETYNKEGWGSRRSSGSVLNLVLERKSREGLGEPTSWIQLACNGGLSGRGSQIILKTVQLARQAVELWQDSQGSGVKVPRLFMKKGM